MKFTKFTTLQKYSKHQFLMFDNKVDLMCMHWVRQFADSSFYNAIQEFLTRSINSTYFYTKFIMILNFQISFIICVTKQSFQVLSETMCYFI